MITGKKPAAAYEDAPDGCVLCDTRCCGRCLCLLISTALVFGTIFALGGKML